MQKSTLFLALTALLLLLGLAGAFLLGGDGESTNNVVLESDGTLAEVEDQAATDLTTNRVDAPSDDLAVPDEPEPASVYDTTLEVFLDLVRPAGQLHAEGSQALGSGATASLIGGLWTGKRSSVRGSVRFVSGSNTGRVLECDRGGRFGANDLYPGISVVEVTGPGIAGSLREMTLRNDRETRLNIGYGRLTTVNGEVVDHAGKPVEGAVVKLDGIPIETDEYGRFTLQGVAGSHGDMVVTVEKAGFSTIRTKTSLTSGTTVPYGRHRYVLRQAGSLEIYIVEKTGATGPAQLYLMPANPMAAQTTFAWHRLNPIAVQPGTTTLVEGLPPGQVRALVFHAGAIAKPRVATATVRAGKANPITIHLEPAPLLSGKVTHDGAPVARAIVRLEAPNRTRAMLNYLGEPAAYLESQVFPNLPPGLSVVKTDDFGNFRIGLFGDASETRYLTATSFDGKLWAGQTLKSGAREVTLELGPAREGDRDLLIEISERDLALKVDLKVDGTPRGLRTLLAGQQLEIGGLMEGDWKLSIRWGRNWLFEEQPISVQDGAAFYVGLPAEPEPDGRD